MNNWQFAWLIWAAIGLGSFVVLETAAVIAHRDTLSECVVNLTRYWPALIGVYILLVVGLGVHFWAPHAGN